MKFKTILNYMMCASIFMDDFIFRRGSFSFDLYYYYFIYMFFILHYMSKKEHKTWLPKWFITVLVLLFTASILSGYNLNTIGFPMFKQIIGITFTSVAYYTFLDYNDLDIKKVFNMYLDVAFVVAAYGVYEEALHLVGVHISKELKRTNFGFYRVYSVMGEPYFLAVALTPAVYYFLAKIFTAQRYRSPRHLFISGVVLSCFVFTFSSAGFIALALMIIFILYNRNYLNFRSWKFYVTPGVVFLMMVLFGNVMDSWKEFNIKFSDTVKAFTQKSFNKKDVSDLNSSTFALYSNYLIAKSSFDQNPLFGSGLGTHEKNYDLRFEKFFDKGFTKRYGSFNKQDANSLFLRLMSETGLMGMSLMFTFILINFLRKKGLDYPGLSDFTLINQGIFILFIIRLLRTGNYIGYGFFFFFFLYYLTRKQVNERLAAIDEEEETVEEEAAVTA